MAQPPSTILLYRGFPTLNVHVWSPFVVKLELRLRLGGRRYKLEQGDPRSGPHGKIPYVDIAPLIADSAPELLGDTSLIAKRLIREGHLTDLNASLSVRDTAFDLSLRALCEDRIYFFEQRERWEENFYTQRDKILAPLPWPWRVIVGSIAYRFVVFGLYAQGVGRYSDTELEVLRRDAWSTLAGTLAEAKRGAQPGRPFWALGGEQPTEADCSIFGFIVSTLVADSSPKGGQIVREHEVFLDYVRRINDMHFPDYEAVA